MSVSQVHFRGPILDTGRVKVDKIYIYIYVAQNFLNIAWIMGYYRKNQNRGVEDMEFLGVLKKKKKNVEIAGVNKKRKGIFLE